MLELTIIEEGTTVTLNVEDSPNKPILISKTTNNQLVDLEDGLYVPLPYRTPIAQSEGDSEEVVMSQDATSRELQAVRDGKVDKQSGQSLISDAEVERLSGVQSGATKNSTDATLLARENHTGEQPQSTITGLVGRLSGVDLDLSSKVEREEGKGLSDNNYTSAEKDKLASLESSRFKGVYTSLPNLKQGVKYPEAGDYAHVDTGVGSDAVVYIYDKSDKSWLPQKSATSLTSAQVKQLYETNPDTNVFKDSDKAKLEGVTPQATKNLADQHLLDRGNHVGTQPISSVDNLGAQLLERVIVTDPRLSDSREWSAPTASEVEANEGASNKRRAWTAERIMQLLVAWWGRTIVTERGDSDIKVMSQKATTEIVKEHLGDIEDLLIEINRGDL